MIEIFVKSIFSFYGIIFFIFLINIFYSKLKTLNIIFLVFFSFISIVYIQNYILKKFSYFSNPNIYIAEDKEYDLIILGGNEIKRNLKAIHILRKNKINKILYVIDKDYKNNFLLNNYIKDKELLFSNKSDSSFEDINFLKKNLTNLNQNIIIVTDDFHMNRIQMLLLGIDKNFVFAPIKNHDNFDKNKLIDLNRGIYYLEIIMKEFAAIIMYYFYYL